MVYWSWLMLAYKNWTCASVPSPRFMLVSLKSAMDGWCLPWKLGSLHIMAFPSWRTVLFVKHLLNVYQHTTKLKSPSGANGSLVKTKPNKYSDFPWESFWMHLSVRLRFWFMFFSDRAGYPWVPDGILLWQVIARISTTPSMTTVSF